MRYLVHIEMDELIKYHVSIFYNIFCVILQTFIYLFYPLNIDLK